MTAAEFIIRLQRVAPGETVTVRIDHATAQEWAEYLTRKLTAKGEKA